jgi:dGTPase
VAAAVPFTAQSWAAVTARWPGITARRRLVPELVREQIGRMTADLLVETRRRIAEVAPQSVADVRAAGRTLAAFSPALRAETDALKAFLRERMYRHPHVAALRDPSKLVVAGLFAALHADPGGMPADWAAATPADEPGRARYIADVIAGMTDRYALKLYQRLVGPSPLPADIII